jgi:hypothetical protein
MSEDNLANHYRTNFALMQHYKYALSDLDNMVPYEREVYVNLLLTHLEEEAQRLKK